MMGALCQIGIRRRLPCGEFFGRMLVVQLPSISHLTPAEKVKLLYRTVVSKVLWKLSRWPFQKTVAIALDSLQCCMTKLLVPTSRLPGEDIDSYFRRRSRQARNLCSQVGFWSELWCQRVINWDQHVRRGVSYQHICANLLNFKDSQWLTHQRSMYVPSNGISSRVSVSAGRTGTRNNIGRPQPRWEAGVALARDVLGSRTTAQRGNNALSIGSRIRSAFIELSAAAQHAFNSS